jgi:hypothetical protein
MKIVPINFDFNRPLVVFSSLQGSNQTQTLPRGHVYNDRSKNSMSKSQSASNSDLISLRFSFERCARETNSIIWLKGQPWTVLVPSGSALQHTRRLHELSRARIASLRGALLHSIRRSAGQQRHADYRRGTEVSWSLSARGEWTGKLIE